MSPTATLSRSREPELRDTASDVRDGWNIRLLAEGVTFDLLGDWIEESYRIVAPKRLVGELDRRTS
jgi:hypothetical protein